MGGSRVDWYEVPIRNPVDLADWILLLLDSLDKTPDDWENWTPDSYLSAIGDALDSSRPGTFYWTGPAAPDGPTWELFADYLLEAVKTYRPDAPQPELRGPLTAIHDGNDFIQFIIDISELEEEQEPATGPANPYLHWARLSGQPPSASADLKMFLIRLSEVVRSAPPMPNAKTAGRLRDQPTWSNIRKLLLAGSFYE